jgi:hypothetical protein
MVPPRAQHNRLIPTTFAYPIHPGYLNIAAALFR